MDAGKILNGLFTPKYYGQMCLSPGFTTYSCMIHGGMGRFKNYLSSKDEIQNTMSFSEILKSFFPLLLL